jgi:hypothetical protein
LIITKAGRSGSSGRHACNAHIRCFNSADQYVNLDNYTTTASSQSTDPTEAASMFTASANNIDGEWWCIPNSFNSTTGTVN